MATMYEAGSYVSLDWPLEDGTVDQCSAKIIETRMKRKRPQYLLEWIDSDDESLWSRLAMPHTVAPHIRKKSKTEATSTSYVELFFKATSRPNSYPPRTAVNLIQGERFLQAAHPLYRKVLQDSYEGFVVEKASTCSQNLCHPGMFEFHPFRRQIHYPAAYTGDLKRPLRL